MKKIIYLLFLVSFIANASDRCDLSEPLCRIAITHMGGSKETMKDFYISSFVQLSEEYSAVILQNNGPADESGLFLVDKEKNYYVTLDYLPSHRGHDYYYRILSHGKDYVVVKGVGGYGYSVEGEVKYEVDFKSRKSIKYKLEPVHVSSAYSTDEFLQLKLFGKNLKNKTIRFEINYDKGGVDYSFINQIPDSKFKKIKSYTKTELKNIKHKNRNITIGKDRIDNVILPQPSISQYEKYRGADSTLEVLKLGYVGFENEISSYFVKNNKIIFGVSFYDGEGSTGIGGVGVYDISKKSYDIHYIKDIANKSIGKMFLYGDNLWSALYHGGEGAKYHLGILKYNLNDKSYQVYDIPGEVDVVISWKDFVFVNTSKGFYQIKENVKKGFFEINSEGDYKLVF